jgi:NADPH:quinone reductase-like Zn-dependent oxidoreductase
MEELPLTPLESDEIRVRVQASSINKAEWYSLNGTPLIARPSMGLVRPKEARFGVDYAGVVEAVGAAVTNFRVGDEVYGGRTGAYGEFVVVKTSIAPKPSNLSFEEAAAVPTAGITALQGLRDHGHLQAGQRVLINGASGGVGTFAVQIAKALGADVTAVCSTAHVETAKSLGADQVIDYGLEDFTASGGTYDLFFDVAGSRPWAAVKRVLAPHAIDVIVGGPSRSRLYGPLGFVMRTKLAAIGSKQKTVFFLAKFNRADFDQLTTMIEAGQVRPVIERRFQVSELAAAMELFGQGHAAGKTVILI